MTQIFRPTGSQPANPYVGSSVRDTAAAGFAAIAQGRATPQDTFPSLISSLQAERQAPEVTAPVSSPPSSGEPPQAPTAPQAKPVGKGGSKLERQAAALVQKYLGVNYVWGGTTPSGFDCSGLVQYVYRSLGVKVPRTTYDQWDSGRPVKQGELLPGDAVFFTGSDPMNGKPGHEGMYIGNGLFIEAPHTGAQVRISKLSDRSDYVGARRFA